MPRLATSLVKRAKCLHPFLPLLLRATRDLDLARNELRWLTEYQRQLKLKAPEKAHRRRSAGTTPPTLHELCIERSRGRPLQYILGTQPFALLEILCRKGVFIPRTTTEDYVVRLADTLLSYQQGRARRALQPPRLTLNIVEPCTGTGCISLALYGRLHPHYKVTVTAVDISKKAVQLARRNLQHNIARGFLPKSARKHIQFQHGDIMDQDFRASLKQSREPFNMAVVNPPYLSETQLRKETERSVRVFEPRTALVNNTLAGEYQDFEMAASSLLDAKEGGILLCEYVDEKAAQLHASREMELSFRRHITDPEPLQHREKRLSVHVWRDGPPGPRPTFRKRLRAIAKGRQSRHFESMLFADPTGPVQAVVAGYGSYAYWLYGSSDLAFRNKPLTITDATNPDGANAAGPRSVKGAAEESSGLASLVASKPKQPIQVPQDSITPNAKNLTKSVCEALDSVRDLSAMVQQQQDIQTKLVEEQAALWEELKNLAEQIKR